MIKANIETAIAILRRAKNLDMQFYQQAALMGHPLVQTEEALHACGNSACFAGHVAVSPEWKAFGGSINMQDGSPYFEVNGCRVVGHGAISLWLGIPIDTAGDLVYGNVVRRSDEYSSFSPYYGKYWNKVETSDVITKLEELLAIGETP